MIAARSARRRPMTRRRPHPCRVAVSAVGISLVTALVAGCVTPATGIDDYRDKAAMSVEAATSEVETARLTARVALADRIFKPYADETISASEQALGSISNSFTSVQPPQGMDRLRDEVSTLLSDAEDAVSAARISIRRSDRDGLRHALDDLDKASADLGRTEERLP